jgi:hypothetical protein
MASFKIPSDIEIEREFLCFENMSQDPYVNDFMLINEISTLFRRAGYSPTPYQAFPSIVFRSRTANVPTLEAAELKFDRSSKLSYPKGDATDYIGLGRCNKAKNAVFYCASENGVPIFEVRPQVGDYVSLAQFRHKTQAQFMFYAPLVGIKQIRENLIKHNISNAWQKTLEEDWVYKTKHSHLIKIDDMVSGWFLKSVDQNNKHYYRLTTIIYNILTEKIRYGGTTLMDGLIYPSVASDTNGFNIALKTEFVDKNLDFHNAIIYHYEQLNVEGHMELRMKKEAWQYEITEEDKLNWHVINLKGISDLFILGTDLTPGEYPQFDPDEHVKIAKEHQGFNTPPFPNAKR